MRKSIWSKFCLILVGFSFFACKAKKALISKPIVNIDTTIPAAVNKIGLVTLKAHQTDFSTFSTKAVTNLDLNGKNYDVTLNIRIKNGETIWLSITAIAGLEVARVLITPDSLKVLDRINNEYIKKPFSFIHDFSNNQINYETLEALLVGNCVPFTLNEESELIMENGILNLKGNSQSLNYILQFNSQFKASQTLLADEDAKQSLQVNIPNFNEMDGQFIPSKIIIESQTSKKNIKANMEFSKVVLNTPLDFPFNVPKRFSEVN